MKWEIGLEPGRPEGQSQNVCLESDIQIAALTTFIIRQEPPPTLFGKTKEVQATC